MHKDHSDAVEVTVFDLAVPVFVAEMDRVNAATRAYSSFDLTGVSASSQDEDSRSLSPEAATVLVAGITSMQALITTILSVLARRKSGSVEIVAPSGAKLTFPYDTAPEKIERYQRIAKSMEGAHIIVSGVDTSRR